MFKQGNYGHELEEHRDVVERKVKAFRERHEYCQQERISKIAISQDKVLVTVEDISVDQKAARNNTEVMIQDLMQLCRDSERDRLWHMKTREGESEFHKHWNTR